MLTSGVPFSGDPGDTNQSNGNGNSDAASAASSGRWSSGRTPAAPTTAPTTQLPSSPLASAQHHRARAIQSGGAAANADAHPFASTQPTAMLAEPWSHQGVHAMSSLERLRPRASPAAVTAEAAAEAATAAAAAATAAAAAAAAAAATVAASSSGSEAVTSGRSSVHHELVQVLPVHHAHASRDGPAHHHMYDTGHAGSAAFGRAAATTATATRTDHHQGSSSAADGAVAPSPSLVAIAALEVGSPLQDGMVRQKRRALELEVPLPASASSLPMDAAAVGAAAAAAALLNVSFPAMPDYSSNAAVMNAAIAAATAAASAAVASATAPSTTTSSSVLPQENAAAGLAQTHTYLNEYQLMQLQLQQQLQYQQQQHHHPSHPSHPSHQQTHQEAVIAALQDRYQRQLLLVQQQQQASSESGERLSRMSSEDAPTHMMDTSSDAAAHSDYQALSYAQQQLQQQQHQHKQQLLMQQAQQQLPRMYIDDPVLDPNALAEANRNAIAPPSLAISQLASESQDALIEMLSNLLDQLISRNDPLPVAKLTHFHAKSPPQINIQLYLQRFAKYAPVGNECFVLLLVYLDRLVQRTGSIITSLNIHRLLLTAILIASKFCQDKYYTNRHFSKVGGLPLNELNMLELEFLTHLDFDLNTSLDWLEKYYVQLRTHFQRKHGAPSQTLPPAAAAAASAAYSTNGQYPTGNATIEASAAAP